MNGPDRGGRRDCMIVGGQYDTYGRVMKLQNSGFHLIHGLGHVKPEGWRD